MREGNACSTRRNSIACCLRCVGELKPLVPRWQNKEIARDWLANGGKRFRPFITWQPGTR
ncbi:MAG: hypothetical protein R3C12_13820 [Planctomycetaceae bacterium]